MILEKVQPQASNRYTFSKINEAAHGALAASLSAASVVRSGRLAEGLPVWAMDANAAVARPGPRLIDGTIALAGIVHPDRVPPDDNLARRIAW